MKLGRSGKCVIRDLFRTERRRCTLHVVVQQTPRNITWNYASEPTLFRFVHDPASTAPCEREICLGLSTYSSYIHAHSPEICKYTSMHVHVYVYISSAGLVEL